ncbi:hypothetical protein C2W62_34850 [Candidatus Entotheonella serta]|nr:hypothetical protein C2W62_34850 [Candidatus Entotheonella serta]
MVFGSSSIMRKVSLRVSSWKPTRIHLDKTKQASLFEARRKMGDKVNTLKVERELRLLIQQQAPSTWQLEDLHDALSIGEDGVGLDSVAMVELFIVCEEHFGLPFPVIMLEDTAPTIGQLIDHVRRLQSGEAPTAT